MSLYAWIPLVAAVASAWLLLNRWAFRDLMSPFNLLLPAWILPLLLKALHLSSKEQPWSSRTVIVLAWVTFALAAVSLFSGFLIRPRERSRQAAVFEGARGIASQRLFQQLTLFWSLLGIAAYFYFEFVTNPIGIPILSYLKDPYISREPLWQWGKDIRLWPLPAMAMANVPVLYFISLCETGRLKRALFLSLALIYPLAALAKMSRVDAVTAVMSMVLVRYYFRMYGGKTASSAPRRPSLARRTAYRAALALIIAGAIIGSATTFSLIRGNRTMGDLSGRLGITLDLPEPARSVVVEVYGYLALPFENLSNFLNDYPGGWHPGVGVLRPAYSVLQLGQIPRDELDAIDFPLLVLPINTEPFIAVVYAESGWLGVLVAPILYAAMVNLIYYRFRERPTFVATMTYVATPISWLWMAMNAEFTDVRYYFYLIYPSFLFVQYLAIASDRKWVRLSHGPA
jgi:hypothetical protein